MPAARPVGEPTAPAADRGWRGKALRYAGGSIVATVCSEVTFVALYGVAHAGTGVSSLLAWLAGAIPNYWLNRTWAWGRTGRASLRREVAPYLTIILVTLGLATLTTKVLDGWLRGLEVRADVRVAAVAAAFFGVYVVVFVLRFLLLDRLFGRLSADEAGDHADVTLQGRAGHTVGDRTDSSGGDLR